MESITYLKNLKLSPKKIRFYLLEVKKLTPNESLKFLYYGKQKATRILYKAIQSAIANAVSTLKTDANLLNFKLLTIEEGKTLKRYRPGARGNVRPIKKHTSHIKIILVAKNTEKPAVVKTEEKTTPADVKKKTELKIKKPAAGEVRKK